MNDQESLAQMNACKARWEALKATGNPTIEAIREIDAATPWATMEPRWWLEMHAVLKELSGGSAASA